MPTDNWCQPIIGANRSKTRHSGLVSYNWIMHVVYGLFVIMFQSQLLRKKSLNWTSLKLLWDIIPNGCCPRLFVGWHDVNLRTIISVWKLGLSSVSLARNGSCRLALKNFKSMFSLKKQLRYYIRRISDFFLPLITVPVKVWTFLGNNSKQKIQIPC